MLLLLLLLLHQYESFASSQHTPPKQIIPGFKRYTPLPTDRSDYPESPCLFPAPYSPPIEYSLAEDSLLRDPIIVETYALLQNSCTTATVKEVFKKFNPDIDTKTSQDLYNQRLTPAQQLALYHLFEKVMQRCDSIMCNPDYKLTQENNDHSSYHDVVTLKSFNDFPQGSYEKKILKIYRFIANAQRLEPWLPKNFDGTQYLKTDTFDWFFEDNSNQRHIIDEEQFSPFFIGLDMYYFIMGALNTIDKLIESKQSDTDSSPLKKHRKELA